MRKTIDLTGQRFGRLTVIERIESKRNYAMWKCLCDCGNYTDSRTGVLLKGRKLSCGCLQKEIASKNQFIDISGERFGNLTAIEPIGKTKHNEIIWKCQCDCGKQTEATGINLRRGHAKSCGCLKGGFASKGKKKSNLGGKYTGVTKKSKRLYRIWIGVKTRCYNPNSGNYKYYGEKGITVCDEWLHNFQAFYDWAMANGYKDGLTLDRKDNSKGYSPDNCKWSTMKEQAQNTSQTLKLSYEGQTKTLSEWSDITGIPKNVLKQRIKYGWSAEKTLTTQVRRTLKK